MTEMPDFMRGEGEKLTSSTVQDDQLKSISELAERIAKLEETITLRENIVKNDKAELRKLTDEELPSAMQETLLRTLSRLISVRVRMRQRKTLKTLPNNNNYLFRKKRKYIH